MINRGKNFFFIEREATNKKNTNREETGKYWKEAKRTIPIRKERKRNTGLFQGLFHDLRHIFGDL